MFLLQLRLEREEKFWADSKFLSDEEIIFDAIKNDREAGVYIRHFKDDTIFIRKLIPYNLDVLSNASYELKSSFQFMLNIIQLYPSKRNQVRH